MKKVTTAERLKQIMIERNLKQVDILRLCQPYCDKYGIKLAKNDLSQYISGKVQPGQDKLTILGLALQVNEVWLMGYDVLSAKDDTKKIAPVQKTTPVLIPVLGYVRAGIPIEAIEEVIDYEEISKEMAAKGEFFALRIKGDSMTPRIQEGDVVVVSKQSDAESSDVVIAAVNGDDACCKKLIKHPGGITLQSFNPAYEPMYFSNEEIAERPVTIIGKVVELRGKF